MKKVICLGGGNNQISVIDSALRQNLEVIVIDQNIESKGAQLSNYFINESTHNFEKIIMRLKEKRFLKNNIVGILNRSSGYPVITNSILSNYLNIKTYSREVAEACISKIKINNFLNKKNILVPKSVYLERKDETENVISPFILKPEITPGGKMGVFYIDSKKKLNSYIEKFHEMKIVKEEFIEGRDICLGAIISKGELLPLVLLEEFHKIDGFGKISSLGITVLQPNSEEKLLKKIISIARSICQILKIINSFFWISFKYTKNKDLFFIELHLDMGGDFVLDFLLPEASNQKDIMDKIIKLFLFGKEYYEGMINVKLTSIEFDKGALISNDGRKLLLKKYSNYNKVIENFKD